MKFAVIVDSRTGNTRQAADWIVEGMNAVDGVEAKAFTIPEIDEEFVKEAKGTEVSWTKEPEKRAVHPRRR